MKSKIVVIGGGPGGVTMASPIAYQLTNAAQLAIVKLRNK